MHQDKPNIIRESPILFLPGVGGSGWTDMRSYLEEYGLIYGGELQLIKNNNDNSLLADWVNAHNIGGDFFSYVKPVSFLHLTLRPFRFKLSMH